MEDDQITCEAVGLLASIVEALDTRDGQTERVGIVPVRIESVSGEERLHPLDSTIIRRKPHPVARGVPARSFKTDARPWRHSRDHVL